jgi:hypothetical protein
MTNTIEGNNSKGGIILEAIVEKGKPYKVDRAKAIPLLKAAPISGCMNRQAWL